MKANLLISITLTLIIGSQLWAAPNNTAEKKRTSGSQNGTPTYH